jgi:gamma-glutamylaminecyclotransferase
MSLIFVYGTLKRGCKNHHYMAGQSFVGPAGTAPGFSLFDLGGHPGMVRVPGAKGVSGELWSVDEPCLARLDELEGTAQGLYRRESVPLEGGAPTGGAQAYLYLGPVGGRPSLGGEWAE